MTDTSVAIVGGCGRVGLPLGLAFADAGLSVVLYDIAQPAVDAVNAGHLPAREPGAQEVLDRVLGRTLTASSDRSVLQDVEVVIIVIGTPVGGHLSPNPTAVSDAVVDLIDHLHSGQLMVIRSTVYPGVTAQVERQLERHGLAIDVAFCPERIAEGKAMTELHTLPQIVGARTPRAQKRAEALFSHLAETLIELSPEEGELAKLFTNVWRYIKFAAANQLFMIANDFGYDYERIRQAIIQEYPRAADLPAAGFAAGPCLLKDTMQLADFDDKSFTLGHASMVVNESMPVYVARCMAARFDLQDLTVGVLGMAFKGESDDIRSSLAYKLKRALEFMCERVVCTDPYVTDDDRLMPLEDVLENADILVIGAPHDIYRDLRTHKQVIDVWNIRGEGVLL